MGGQAIWKRLLWKELRESWGVLIMMLAVPMVLLGLSSRYAEGYSIVADISRLMGSVGTYVLLVLWAAGKGDRGKSGNQFSLSHLPVKPTRFWWSSFALPALMAVVLGAWFGWWSGMLIPWDAWQEIALGSLEFVAIFAFCYYFAAAVSKWLAILIGVAHVVSGASLISVWDLQLLWIRESILFMASVALGAFVASYVFAWLANRKTIQSRQAISLGVMLVIAMLPVVEGIDVRGYMSNSSKRLVEQYLLGGHSGKYYARGNAPGKIVLHEYETGKEVERKMPHPAVVIEVTDKGSVYLAEQKKGSEVVDIVLWDSRADTVKRLASISTGRKALGEFNGASVDPKGRYILMSVGDLIGSGNDVWIVDLNKGSGCVVVPCVRSFNVKTGNDWGFDNVIWLSNRVYVSAFSTSIVKIDLRTMKAKPYDIFAGEGRNGL